MAGLGSRAGLGGRAGLVAVIVSSVDPSTVREVDR